MAKGGYRPGSGRKPGVASILAEKTRAYIAERLNKDIEPMYEALSKKAKKGDVFAFKELYDRAHGKAAQSIDHTTAGEKFENPILPYVSRDNSPTKDTKAG